MKVLVIAKNGSEHTVNVQVAPNAPIKIEDILNQLHINTEVISFFPAQSDLAILFNDGVVV